MSVGGGATTFTVMGRFVADTTKWVRGQTEALKANQRLASSLDAIEDAARGVQQSTAELSAGLQRVAARQRAVTQAISDTTNEMRAGRRATTEASDSFREFGANASKAAESVDKVSKATRQAQDQLGRRGAGRFGGTIAADASKATTAVKAFTLAAGAGGVAFLALNRSARTSALEGAAKGAQALAKGLQSTPGAIRSVVGSIGDLQSGSKAAMEALGSFGSKATKVAGEVRSAFEKGFKIVAPVARKIADVDYGKAASQVIQAFQKAREVVKPVTNRATEESFRKLFDKAKGAATPVTSKVTEENFKKLAQTAARVYNTGINAATPHLKQAKSFDAVRQAATGTVDSVMALASAYGRLGGIVNSATGGLVEQAKQLATGNASLRDIRDTMENVQRQAGRLATARRIEAKADPNASASAVSAKAARDVAIMNVAGAGFGKFREKLVSLGRANKELADSTSHVDRARNAYASLFNVAGGVVLAAGIGKLTSATVGFIRSTLDAGARSKELDVVLSKLGSSAGYNEKAIRKQVDALREAGIESKAAKSSLSDFIKVGIPVDQAEKLSKVARDFAVLAGSDTSQTFQNIVYGIASRQTDVLRTAGVQVSFEQAFSKFAQAVGKSSSELTEAEKTQAGLNAVLEAGVQVQGAYEQAMGTAGKQLRSTKRYVEEIRNELGGQLEPAFASAVKIVNEFVKPESKLAAMAKSTGVLGRAFGEMGQVAKDALDGIHDRIEAALDSFDPSRIAAFIKGLQGGAGEAVMSLMPAGLAALAFHLSQFIPMISGMLGPLKMWQVILGTIVLANNDLRGALISLLEQVGKAAAILSAALLPIFVQIVDFLNSNSGSISGVAKDFGDLAVGAAKAGAVFLQVASGPLKVLLSLLGQLLRLIDAMNGVSFALGLLVAFKTFDRFAQWHKSINDTAGAFKALRKAMEGVAGVKAAWQSADPAASVAKTVTGATQATQAAAGVASSMHPGGMGAAANASQQINNSKATAASAAASAAAMAGTANAAKQAASAVNSGAAAAKNVAGAAGGATKELGRMAKAWATTRSVVSNGLDGTVNATKAWASSLDAATKSMMAMSVVMAGLTIGWMLYQNEAEKQRKRFDESKKAYSEWFREQSKNTGVEGAFKSSTAKAVALKTEIGDVTNKLKELGATDRALKDYDSANQDGNWFKKAWGFAFTPRQGVASESGKIYGDSELKKLADERIKLKNELEVAKAAQTEQMGGFTEEMISYSQELVKYFDGAEQAVTSAGVGISATFGTNAAALTDFSKLTQAQAQELQGSLTALADSAYGWTEQMTSFSGALGRKEVKDFGTLMAHYDEMRARVEWFWADIAALQKHGVDQKTLMDWVAAGPTAVGDELARWRKQFDDADAQASANMLERVKSSSTAIKQANDAAIQAIAEQWLASGEAAKVSTPEQANAIAKEAAAGIEKIKATAANVEGGTAGLVNSAQLNEGNVKAATDYQAGVDRLMAVISNGKATAKQRMDQLGEVLSLGAALKKADPTNAELVTTLNEMMQTMVQAAGPLSAQIQSVGGSWGDNFAIGFGSAANVGLAAQLELIAANAQAAMSRIWSSMSWGNLADSMGGLLGEAMKGHTAKEKARRDAAANPLSSVANPTTVRADEGSYGGTDVAAKAANHQAAVDRATEAQKAMGEAAANLEKQLADLRQQITEANPPLSLFAEAWEKLIGNARAWQASLDDSATAVESYAKSLVQLAASSEAPERKARSLRAMTDQLIASVRAETEAAVKAGRVHNDTASITAYFTARLAELQNQIPGLVKEFTEGARSVDDLREAVSAAQKTLDDGLALKLDMSDAVDGAIDALDTLDQRIKDQRALLTGQYLTDKERGSIQRETTRDLNSYVRALESEAKALAMSGKIGADAASIQQHIRDGLDKAKVAYPELASQIDDYASSLTQAKGVADDASEKTTLQVQVEQALNDIKGFEMLLAGIPAEASTILSIKIDEASKQAVDAYLEQIASIQANLADANTQANDVGFTESLYDNGPPAKAGFIDAKDGNPGGIYRQAVTPKAPIPTSPNLDWMGPLKPPPTQGRVPAVDLAGMRGIGTSARNAAKDMMGLTSSGNKSVALFDDLVEAATLSAKSMAEAGAIDKDWTSIQREVIRQLRTAAQQYPEVTGLVDEYSAAVESVPPEQVTTFVAQTDGARAMVDSFRILTDSLPSSKQVSVNASVTGADQLVWVAGALQETSGQRHLTVTADASQAVLELANLAAVRMVATGSEAVKTAAQNVGSTAMSIVSSLFRDTGGPLPSGTHLVTNATGRDEWVLNPGQMSVLMSATGTSTMPAALGVLSNPTAFSDGSVTAGSGRGSDRWDDVIAALRDAVQSRGNTVVEQVDIHTGETSGAAARGLWAVVNQTNGN